MRQFDGDIMNVVAGRLRFKWGGTLKDALEERGDAVYTSESFETQVADLQNWIVGRSILDLLPEIRDQVEVTDDDYTQALES